jgi:hypothetical protein
VNRRSYGLVLVTIAALVCRYKTKKESVLIVYFETGRFARSDCDGPADKSHGVGLEDFWRPFGSELKQLYVSMLSQNI